MPLNGLVIGVAVYSVASFILVWWLVWFPWLENFDLSFFGLLNFLCFHALAAYALYCYRLAVTLDPGFVPSSWTPPGYTRDQLEDHKSKQRFDPTPQLPKALRGPLRYCHKCEAWKPPRAHHCRSCDRCVLRMDHHCPWIGNCVGHKNHKAFLLFLIVSIAAQAYAFLLELGHLIAFFSSLSSRTPSSGTDVPWGPLSILVDMCFIVGLGLGMSGLLIWQLILLRKNMTSVEEHEVSSAKRWLRERGKDAACDHVSTEGGRSNSSPAPAHKFHHPYDVGVRRNIGTVMGEPMWRWLVVTSPSLGDGYSWPTNNSERLSDDLEVGTDSSRPAHAEDRRELLEVGRDQDV